MSVAAALGMPALSYKLSSGLETCSRSSPACWGGQPANLPRRRAPWLAAAQPQPACSSSSWGCGSGSSRCSSRARRQRPLLPLAAAEAEAPQQAGAMVPDRQGYRSLQLEECEFLIAETPEGRLDLRDAYVTTDVGSEEPSYRRVEGLEGITGQPQAYQEVPWYSEYPGDAINNTPAKIWVWRIFLVPIVAEDPEDEVQLAFENIWVLDGKTASLKQCEVQRLAPPDTPPQDLRLRIRDDVVTIDTSESLPEWEYAVQARRNGVPALSELEQERLKQYLSSLEEAYKQGAIDEMDYATAKDVHWLAALQAGGEGLPALNGSWEPSSTAGVEAVSFGPPNQQEEVSGPWELDGYGDEELLVDMMPQYDDEAEEEGEYDDFDSPAADY